jgi:transposase InsO family protein
VLENLALRQQLATLRARRRPVVDRSDRAFWVLLHRYWSGWAGVLVIVGLDTVVRWHRAGFRAFWYRRSRASVGRPRTDRSIAALVIVWHGRRAVVRCGVTSRPNATWIFQQLREAFPFDSAPRFLIHDRDDAFQNEVQSALRSLAITPVRTSFRSPWQNGVAERFIGTLRRELLDHVIVLGEHHLRGLIDDEVAYRNRDRTHLAAGKDAPMGRHVELRPEPDATVVSLPRVGGLHRRYAWRRAA